MPRGDLFPEIGPFETGYMPLPAGHVMYWEQVGATRGQPVLFLHGGPGAGAGAVHRRFFDPAFWRLKSSREASQPSVKKNGNPSSTQVKSNSMVLGRGLLTHGCLRRVSPALRSFPAFPPTRHHEQDAEYQATGKSGQNNQHQWRLPGRAKKEVN